MKFRPGTMDVQAIEEQERDVYGLRPAPLGTVIDLGANIGAFTNLVMQLHPTARVHAYEPEDSNYEYLVANTKHFPTVKTFRQAVWSHDRGVKVYPYQGCSTTSETDGKQDVESVTLEMVLAPFESVDLLKCDTEGAEHRIFKDVDEAVMNKIDQIRMEIHFGAETQQLCEALSITHLLMADHTRPDVGGYWFWERK